MINKLSIALTIFLILSQAGFVKVFAQEAFIKQSFLGSWYAMNDFNQDDKTDLFISDYQSFGNSELLLLVNQCTPNEIVMDTIFISVQEDIVGTPSSGDFDFDGDADILYQKGDNADMQLLLNNGDLTFEQIDLGLQNSFLNEMVDIDSDGDNDILGISFDLGDLYLFVNDGNNNFQTHYPLADDQYIASKRAHDIDEDGDMDIIVGLQNWDERHMVFLINEGNLVFTEQEINLSFPNDDVEHLKVLDYDEDGLDDIIYQDKNKLIAMINQGDGTYEELKILPLDNSDYYPFLEYAFGDLDNDGKLDIVTGGSSAFEFYPINFFLNESNDPMNPEYRVIEVGGVSPGWKIDLFDIDCDTDLDIMVNNGGDNWLFLNRVEQYLPVEEINSNELIVYPNPATNTITVGLENFEIESAMIYNALGIAQYIPQKNLASISVEHLPVGLYYLSVKTKDGIKQSSFIKN